jgi:diamine N-acetyltransferase
VYVEETPVGFLMHGLDDTGERWIIRLMVDAEHQGRGYGRAAMALILAQFRADPQCRSVAISYEPDNKVAAALYQSLGFEETGEIDDGELVARLRLDTPAPA